MNFHQKPGNAVFNITAVLWSNMALCLDLFSVTCFNGQICTNLLGFFSFFFSFKLVAILPRAALPVPVFPILQPALDTSDPALCMALHQSSRGSTDLQGVNLQETSLCPPWLTLHHQPHSPRHHSAPHLLCQDTQLAAPVLSSLSQ